MGLGFTPFEEASSGRGSTSSATNYPLLILERQDNEAVHFAPIFLWGTKFFFFDQASAEIPAGVQPGWHAARIAVNGVVSEAQSLLIQ